MTHLDHDWFPRPVPDNVEVGERSWLHSSYAFLHFRSTRPRAVRIGHDTGVYNRCYFDLGPDGSVSIGNYGSIVGAIFSTNGDVVIGDHALVAHEVHFADHAAPVPPDRVGEVPRRGRSGDISIGDNVWIGARAVILGGTSLEDDVIVGAGAVVLGHVPRGSVVTGNPARAREAASS